MHLPLPGRGTGEDGDPIIIRSLTREYRVSTDCTELRSPLSFLSADPEIAGTPLEVIPVAVDRAAPFYRMTLPRYGEIETDAKGTVLRLHRLIVRGLIEELPEGMLLHGASLRAGANRIVLLGHKGSGKTTLALRLLLEGFDFEGDEHVALREDDVLARPRRLRVKEGSLRFFPSLRDRIAAASALADWDGTRIYSVDPRVGGHPWRILPGPVAHFVLIEPNHGGHAVLTPLPFERLFRALVSESILLGHDKLGAAKRIRRHLTGSRLWRLSLGDHAGAVRHLRRLAS